MLWTEDIDIVACKLRMTKMPIRDIAEALSKVMGTPISKSSLQARLSKRGVRIVKPLEWFEKDEAELMRVLRGEISLDDAADIREAEYQAYMKRTYPDREPEHRYDERMAAVRRGRIGERFRKLKWRVENLTGVPEDPKDWPEFRTQLLGEGLELRCRYCGANICD